MSNFPISENSIVKLNIDEELAEQVGSYYFYISEIPDPDDPNLEEGDILCGYTFGGCGEYGEVSRDMVEEVAFRPVGLTTHGTFIWARNEGQHVQSYWAGSPVTIGEFPSGS